MDEMSINVEENSRTIFLVYDVVLEDFVVECAGKCSGRWHSFDFLFVCVTEKGGSSLMLVQSSRYAALAKHHSTIQRDIVCRMVKVDVVSML